MTIKKYFAIADNTISNAFDRSLTTNNKATGSNMGAADILEVFQLYGQASTGSVERSRVLIQFDTTKLSSDRTAGKIPASGSVAFFLNLYNVEHTTTLPENFDLSISAVSQPWEEGTGLDMVNYTDKTYEGSGSNWIQAKHSASSDDGRWTSQGGDYHADPVITKNFPEGYEDLSVDVSDIVEQWLAGTKQNYGFGIKLSDQFEEVSGSYYTKKFFARGTEFFFYRPSLEAKWDNSIKDDRGYFFASSSLAPADDNQNNLYLYNRIRGRLRNIPDVGTGEIRVDLYDSIGSTTSLAGLTGSHVSTGVYKCAASINTTASTLYDVWHSDSTQYHTGTISLNSHNAQDIDEDTRYLISIPNLNSNYYSKDVARFKLYVRPKKWSPNIYTVAKSTPENITIPSASYEIYRLSDELVIIPHDTGSNLSTMMSYNVSGNYFNLDMSLLESGYDYGIRIAFYDDYQSNWNNQPYEFRFKVNKDEY